MFNIIVVVIFKSQDQGKGYRKHAWYKVNIEYLVAAMLLFLELLVQSDDLFSMITAEFRVTNICLCLTSRVKKGNLKLSSNIVLLRNSEHLFTKLLFKNNSYMTKFSSKIDPMFVFKRIVGIKVTIMGLLHQVQCSRQLVF